ncbi:L,D-transpeptidase family protein [Clostridium grantii]|uniref:Peptidoglycan transpeptidase, ErfK-YbiS-YhnG family n=1 Tax=Clostridium grantii DSM 8605 TaxID=1121316 RepID=A0A1M5W0T2_9CLOT|nr:peptidoglycan binding domain-containing protein [Clostridium grantii]SHH81126.1 peptidoglycan transpeptidase precursor, ErfK-YbiS-YhnG family [Clostridium grantii DSM 8605]
MENLESELKGNKKINSISSLIKRHKKITIALIVCFSIIIFIYVGMSIYFMNHFYFGSTINCVSVSGKSVEEVESIMANELEKYNITLNERNGKSEQIVISDIGLSYVSGKEFKDSKDTQQPFKWIVAVLSKKENAIVEEIKFDEKLLKERVDKLTCFDTNNIVEPVSASIKYEKGSYQIVPEVLGTKVDKDILYKNLLNALEKSENSIDLEKLECYVKPEFTSTSEKIIEAKELLNKYVSSKVTYTFGKEKEILDSSLINEWIEIDENLDFKINENKVKDYVETLAKDYNTVGKKRDFVASTGEKIKVGGGDYGWIINKAKETQALIEDIKEGKTVEKKPSFTQTAIYGGDNDIGNTYIEISLTSQHLWLYKNGALITDGPVVTGNIAANNGTPAGVYKLKYKQKDAVLRGEDYETNVEFWMPFNGNIGIHDATWRKSFGEQIYMTNGSHGCVNSPHELAEAVYLNIKAGIPVICYN